MKLPQVPKSSRAPKRATAGNALKGSVTPKHTYLNSARRSSRSAMKLLGITVALGLSFTGAQPALAGELTSHLPLKAETMLKTTEPRCSGFGSWRDCTERDQWRAVAEIKTNEELYRAYRKFLSPLVSECYKDEQKRNFQKSTCRSTGNLTQYASQLLDSYENSDIRYVSLECGKNRLQHAIDNANLKLRGLQIMEAALVVVDSAQLASGGISRILPSVAMGATRLKLVDTTIHSQFLKIGKSQVSYAKYSTLLINFYTCKF